MTKHKHAEMIKAKVDNMELVVFIRPTRGKWQECESVGLPSFENGEYFMSLPKHKEACLHWLSGGEIEFNSELSDGWEEYDPINIWGIGSIFMQDDYEIRIKPHKEKLWIAVKMDGYERLGGNRKVRVCSHAFVSKLDAEEYLDLNDSVLVEIEM